MEYVALADSNYLTVYPDLGNLTNAAKTYQTSVEDDIRTGKGHLCAMHLKETVPACSGRYPSAPATWTSPRHRDSMAVRRAPLRHRDVGRGKWNLGSGNPKAVAMMRQLLDRQG